MNLSLPADQVSAMCQHFGIAISDIETLPNGGTHLVCRNSQGAEEIRQKLAKCLMRQKISRYAFYSPQPPGWRAPPSARLPQRAQ